MLRLLKNGKIKFLKILIEDWMLEKIKKIEIK